MNQTTSVSRVILEKYQMKVTPGKKHNCPKCNHHTLSIKNDDSIAWCFHTECDFRVLQKKEKDQNSVNCIETFVERLVDQSHKALIGEPNNAYDYLVHRKIHSKVIFDTLLGVVRLNQEFEDAVCDGDKMIEAFYQTKLTLLEGKKGSNDSKEFEKASIEKQRQNDKEKFQSLVSLLRKAEGWLLFFHTNSNFEVTKILLRRPFTKEFMSYKIGKSNGLFGLTLFNNDKVNDVIVHEGEFNALHHQSLLLRAAEDEGKDLSFVEYDNIIAIGSSSEPDFDSIQKLSTNPVFFPDADEAGQGVIAKAIELFNLRVAELPGSYNDIDEYLKHQSQIGNVQLLADVNMLIENAQQRLMTSAGISKKIAELRDMDERDHHISSAVSNAILRDIELFCRFYRSRNQLYLFDTTAKKIFALEDNDRFRLFMSRYGLNAAEQIFKYVLNALKIYVMEHGIQCDIRNLSHYDKESNRLYIYDNLETLYEVRSDSVQRLVNGNYQMIFEENDCEPISISDSKDGDPLQSILLQSINFLEDILTDSERQFILRCYTESTLFPNLMPTRPILTIYGEKGAGKSNILRRIGLMLFGKGFEVISLPKDPQGFDTIVANTKLAAFDNVDSTPDWFCDRITAVATGVEIRIRKLYTDSQIIKFKADTFLALTSRTPHFRRDDVADRLLIMKLRPISERRTELEMIDEIILNRPALWAQLVEDIQSILRILPTVKNYLAKTRMADFERFAYICAQAYGEKYGVTLDNFDDLFERLRESQENFTTEYDVVLDLLRDWATANQGREIRNSQLFGELRQHAFNQGFKFPISSIQSFSQKIKAYRKKLEDEFNIEEVLLPYGARAWRYTKKGNTPDLPPKDLKK